LSSKNIEIPEQPHYKKAKKKAVVQKQERTHR